MTLRLRAPALAAPFNVVLVEPEIPQNTGNIGRLCAATQSKLHLVGRLGFRVDEHAVRRAGLDYWHLVDMQQHASLDHFAASCRPPRTLYFSGKTSRSYLDAGFRPGDALVFGKESTGLDASVIERAAGEVFAIPTLYRPDAPDEKIAAVRSLNLGNAVAIVLYEALRQVGALDAVSLGE
ncbi:MAG: tRNA (cytidine(34)-2'-O)-methyltransferase [Polyangiaceae bacterium]|nr:tRNA (cytidine(34)-2'-O)-methyltransferase [Polyangiaceae bacterium]